MVKIDIEPEIAEKCPDVTLGCISCEVETKSHDPLLWKHIEKHIDEIAKRLSVEEIKLIDAIASSKQAYRSLGKDPSRYRLSAEALLRRIANGKGLYQVNNIVDLLNLVSIISGFSIGGYNFEKIKGPIRFGKGHNAEYYEGIGRGKLNIENLPVFRDDISAFGSPTSDSPRTQIDEGCRKFLMIIISFQGEKKLQAALSLARELLQNYAKANHIEIQVIAIPS